MNNAYSHEDEGKMSETAKAKYNGQHHASALVSHLDCFLLNEV